MEEAQETHKLSRLNHLGGKRRKIATSKMLLLFGSNIKVADN